MPELPEVETVRRQLLPQLLGKTINGVEVFHAKTVNHDDTIEARLCGHSIAAIERIGKLLIFSFTNTPDLFLLAHLKMTGQFFYLTADHAMYGGGHKVSEKDVSHFPGRHTRVAFHFSDHSVLYFNDMRLFGYTKLATAAQVAVARAGFGPEPIDPTFDVDWFMRTICTRKTSIKAVLLDQSFIAGLGNIYVDEALFQAGIRPQRSCRHITQKEARALAHAARTVMQTAITFGGTTFQHFVDTTGKNGNFTDQLQVFGRQGQPCLVCGTRIEKEKVAGRGTHYCPTCQT